MTSKSPMLLLLGLLLTGHASAQKIYTYADSTFSYRITTDSTTTDSITYDCSIKSIEITRLTNHKLVQAIHPPENTFFCNMPKDQVIIIEDVNFDGYNDLRIVQFIPAAPNIPYFYWVFNKNTGQFESDTTLEDITSPEFDHVQKKIFSSWRGSYCDHGLSVYQYIHGKITLIEENEIRCDDPKYPGKVITTKKKLVKGKMKLIERTVERDESE